MSLVTTKGVVNVFTATSLATPVHIGGFAALLSVASRRLSAASVRCPVIVPLLTGNPEITAAHVLPFPSKFRKVSVCGVLPVPGVLILDPLAPAERPLLEYVDPLCVTTASIFKEFLITAYGYLYEPLAGRVMVPVSPEDPPIDFATSMVYPEVLVKTTVQVVLSMACPPAA